MPGIRCDNESPRRGRPSLLSVRQLSADLCHSVSSSFPDGGKARYELHKNSIEDADYVDFLNRIIRPMLPYLHNDMRGLDYGSGPSPVLSQLVRRQGFTCEDYDPFFADRSLQPPYDFIFSTECFEHFHYPRVDIQRICTLLKPGGLLGIMTGRWTILKSFANWHYTHDLTHVSFYHAKTFDYLCRHYGLTILWQDEKRSVIFRRDHVENFSER